MALEPMQGNRASSRCDLGYTELFRVPVGTSGSISTCEIILGDSLEFHQGSQGSFLVWWGTRTCAARNAGESHLILRQGGSLIVFLKLQWEPGVYSRVTGGMGLQTRVCSVTSGLLSSYEGHLRNLFQAWQGNRDASQGEAQDPGSLSIATG